MNYIDSDPYQWPYNGDLRLENTAGIAIDMQTDVCSEGGYVDKMQGGVFGAFSCSENLIAQLP
jgi:hypothetical protein